MNFIQGEKLEAAKLLRFYIEAADSEDIRNYASGLLRNIDQGGGGRFFWSLDRVAQLAELEPSYLVLDVGSGFSYQAAILSWATGATIHANDVRPEILQTAEKSIRVVQQRGYDVNVTPMLGDICTLPIEDSTYDAIICNQTIEHVHDLERMFLKCFRVLRACHALLAARTRFAAGWPCQGRPTPAT